jgi:hypothetical protein
MLEIAIAAGFCLGILGAWFLLRIGLAEVLLTLIVVLSAAAANIYCVWTGGWFTEIAESLGIPSRECDAPART